MRGVIPGLATPHPLLHQLPGVFQDSEFTARFLAAFDEALAPVFSVLDNLRAHVDPDTAPPDLLAFVGMWVAANREDATPLPVQRVAVREAVSAHRRRGTVAGLAQIMGHLTGGDVEVTDSGGTTWSSKPGAGLPGAFPARVHISVAVDDPDAVDLGFIESVVTDAIPPYVSHEIEVVRR